MRHDLGSADPPDFWQWRTIRPGYMREIEPLARESSWPSPSRKIGPSPEAARYRMQTLKRIEEGERVYGPAKAWALKELEKSA